MTRRIPRGIVLSFAGAVFLATFVAALCAPSSARAEKAGIGWNESIAAAKGKAKTMAELSAMYDSAPCAECHKEIFDQWRETTHSSPIFGSGRMARDFWAYVQDGLMKWEYSGVKSLGDVRVEHLMECAKCHLPQLADAEDSVAREIVAVLSDRQSALDRKDSDAAERASAQLKTLNVGCLICHNRNAVVHKWMDGYPKRGEIHGRKEGTHPGQEYTILKRNPILGESILCGQCHGLGPNLDMANANQCTTLYGSYIFAYRAHGGKETCQDCHMRKHKSGHRTRAYSDPEMIRSALEVKTQTHGFFWRDNFRDVPRVIVDVSISNRTGHSLPDSTSFNRRLVLTVTVKKSDGTAHSEERVYMQFPQRLGRGNKMGRAAYEKTGIIEDSALHPYAPVNERFDFALEPEEEGTGKRKKLLSEADVIVKIRRLSAEDAPDSNGVVLYETSRTVTIEER
jgi:nitrate/TMAO reductase-like tetraheme cytochrome c subunit